MFHPGEHRFFCNFVEGDPLGFAVGQMEHLLEMPGNRFPFPVRVGGQVDEIAFLRRFFQLVDDFVLALDGLVLGGKVPVDIDAHLLFGQIPQMPHGCLDHIVRPQVFADGFRLGRRFHDE